MPDNVSAPTIRTCPSSRYKWSCGDMWFRQLGCLLGHRNDDRVGLLGPAHKKIRPKSVPGRVSTPIWHVGHYDIALAAHARSRFSSMMRRFWTVLRTSLKTRKISHLFEGWGWCGSLREGYVWPERPVSAFEATYASLLRLPQLGMGSFECG